MEVNNKINTTINDNTTEEWYVDIDDTTFYNLMKPLHLTQTNTKLTFNNSSSDKVSYLNNRVTNDSYDSMESTVLEPININPVTSLNKHLSRVCHIKTK